MMRRCIHETRLAYLLRVAISHIREHAADEITEYDEAECDGACLADELQHELDTLPAAKPEPRAFRYLAVGEIIDASKGDEYQLFKLDADGWRPSVRRPGAVVTPDTAGQYRRPIFDGENPENAAYTEGWTNGMYDPASANPYTEDTPQAMAWAAGFNAAKANHEAKEPPTA